MQGQRAVVDRAPAAVQGLVGEDLPALAAGPDFSLTAASASLRLGLNAGLLPQPVRWFYLQALGAALRMNDRWTLAHAPSSEELARLLEASRGAELAVEIGAHTEWTTIALALAAEERNVISVGRRRQGSASYAQLVEERVHARIGLYESTAASAAHELEGSADFVLVDATSAQSMGITLSSATQIIRPGGIVVVCSADSREVRSVVGELGIEGPVADGLLLWRKPGEPEPLGVPREVGRPRNGLLVYGFVGTVIGLAVAAAGPKIASITEDLPGTTGHGREVQSTRLETAVGRARERRAEPGNKQANSRSLAVGRSAVRVGGSDRPKLFYGSRTRRLGTLRVDVPTVLTWRSSGNAFSINSAGWHFRTRAHRGTTLLSPGTYRTVTVRAREWKLRLAPTR